jgi:hypothetical protein
LVVPSQEQEAPVDKEKEWIRFDTKSLKVSKKKNHKDNKPWNEYVWSSGLRAWMRNEHELTPRTLPDAQLDITANHCFHHAGKKTNKHVFYKGYEGKFLDQKTFNTLTVAGCASCGRTPIWTEGRMGGVSVRFFTEQDFLCSYCAEDDKLLNSLIDLNDGNKHEHNNVTRLN